MIGRALRKNSLQWNIAAAVLLKLFISGNERCHITEHPSAWAVLYFQNVNKMQPMIPEDQGAVRQFSAQLLMLWKKSVSP